MVKYGFNVDWTRAGDHRRQGQEGPREWGERQPGGPRQRLQSLRHEVTEDMYKTYPVQLLCKTGDNAAQCKAIFLYIFLKLFLNTYLLVNICSTA